MPNGETKKVEQLQSEVSELQDLVTELKSKRLPENERRQKENEVKNKAQELQGQVDILSEQQGIDEKLREVRDTAKIVLASCNDTLNLQLNIGEQAGDKAKAGTTDNPGTSVDSTITTGTTEGSEKGFFGKTGDWVGEQWSDIRSGDKREKERGKNLLRTVGFLVTGVGPATLAYKGAKKLRNWAFGKKKKDEESESKSSSESSSKKDTKEEEKSFWDKPVGKFIKGVGAVLGVGTGVYYVAHGLYTQNRGFRDLWDREKGKKLEFDAALEYCKGAISNQDNIEGMGYGLDLKYYADTGEIEAFGEKIKIDKNNRKIEGLEIDFNKYEHMINTAIVIAYLKKNYAGKCVNNSPFNLNGSWQGDINVSTQEGNQEAVDGTGNGGRITGIGTAAVASIITAIRSKNIKLGTSVLTAGGALGFAGGYVFDSNNIMNKNMPELDDENGRKNLTAYLNSMACREARNQTAEDITESPIKKEVVKCMEEIQQSSPELPNFGDVRKIDAIQDPNNPEKYIIKAYKRKILAKVTGEHGDRKINILGIDGGNPTIKTNMEKSGLSNLNLPLKEGLYMSCLTGFFLNNYHHKGSKYPWFEYTWRANHAFKEGIYFSNDGTDTRVYSKNAFQQKMPTLFQEENRKKYLEFLNDGITGENNVSIRKK